MKSALFTKTTAVFLSLIMLVLVLPINAFAYETGSNLEYVKGETEKGRYEHLGYGFNALSNKPVKVENLKTTAGSIIDYNTVEAGLLGTSSTEAFVEYAKSAQELMLEFGIDYSNKSSMGIPISDAKVGFSSKFGINANFKNKAIVESLYYYYRQETITDKFSLILPESDNLEKIINKKFKDELDKLNANFNDTALSNFFEKWGTHTLISYNKGGALEYVATGHSTGELFSANAEIESELSSSANFAGIFEAESTQALSVKMATEFKDDKYNFSQKWYAYGGLTSVIGGDSVDSIAVESIAEWKKTIEEENSENCVLIPQSTEWIPIWEFIPDSYADLKSNLQNHYKTRAIGINAEFFSAFTTYSEVAGTTNIYYKSPVTGHISRIAYNGEATPVAPDSSFNIVNIGADLSNIVFPESNKYTVDKNGIVKILATSGTVTVKVTDTAGNVINGATKTFTVANEGAGLFAGGYGTTERPYLISNATQFSNIRNYPSASFKLTNNISLGNISPIDSFSGTFDGNGYTLSGWSYTQTTVGNIGLFATNSKSGTIKNLKISGFKIGNNNPYISGTLHAGLVCGNNEGTLENIVISNSSLDVDIGDGDLNQDSYIRAGLLCGYLSGTISKCVVETSTIKAVAYTRYQGSDVRVGGLVGYSSGGTITDVTSHNGDREIVGTAGANYKKNLFGKCKEHGRPYSFVGGIVGYANETTITRALGYENYIKPSAPRGCGCGTNTQTAGGSIIGYKVAESGSWTACYSETEDGTLVGSDNNSASNTYKRDSLSAAGVISSLTGYASGWFQSSSGGHPSIAQNSALQINSDDAKTKYFVGEPIDFSGLKFILEKQNGTNETIDISEASVFKASEYLLDDTVGERLVTITYGYDPINKKELTASYKINVVNPEVCSIEVSNQPHKTIYFKGEKVLHNGLAVIAKYTDGTTTEIPFNELTLSNSIIADQSKAVTVSYKGFETSYQIEVHDILPMKIEPIEGTYKQNYAVEEAFDASGLKVKLTYNNGETEELGIESLKVDTTNCVMDTAGSYTVKVKYGELETTYDILVGSVKKISIATLPQKLSYYSSEKRLSTEGLSINATYDNGVTKVITTGFTVSGYNNTEVGEQDITVSFGGATTTYQVTVVPVEMVSIDISEYPKTTYFVGNTLTTSGLVVKVNYNDSSSKIITDGFTVKLEGYDVDDYPTLITLGKKSVLVAYYENGIRKTVEYEIDVVKDSITDLQLVQDPEKTTYNLWDEFNYSGMMVYAVYASGKAEHIELDKTMFSVQTFNNAGTQPVILNYKGHLLEVFCVVNAPYSINITKLPIILEYEVGEEILSDGIEVKANFSNGAEKDVTNIVEYAYPSTQTAGDKIVYVKLGVLSTEYNIAVKEHVVDENEPQITVKTVMASIGNKALVTVNIKNNPGIWGMDLNVMYDKSQLTLNNVTNGAVFSDSEWVKGNLSADTYILSYEANDFYDIKEDGLLATLEFVVNDNATPDLFTEIFVSYNNGDIINVDFEDVDFAVVSGGVGITDFIYGDLNDDGIINKKDSLLMKMYLADNTTVINMQAADVFVDESVNKKDSLYLKQYLAGWDVVLGA